MISLLPLAMGRLALCLALLCGLSYLRPDVGILMAQTTEPVPTNGATGRSDYGDLSSPGADGDPSKSLRCHDHARLQTVTPTPTPDPTLTPIPEIAVVLIMSANYFVPGDECWLQAALRNPGASLPPFPLVVVFAFHGEYFMWPSWAPAPRYFDYKMVPVPSGISKQEIIGPFSWPEGLGSDEGLMFISAFLTSDFKAILGDFDVWTFSYHE